LFAGSSFALLVQWTSSHVLVSQLNIIHTPSTNFTLFLATHIL